MTCKLVRLVVAYPLVASAAALTLQVTPKQEHLSDSKSREEPNGLQLLRRHAARSKGIVFVVTSNVVHRSIWDYVGSRVCSLCNDSVEESMNLKCGHRFCAACRARFQTNARLEFHKNKTTKHCCPLCRDVKFPFFKSFAEYIGAGEDNAGASSEDKKHPLLVVRLKHTITDVQLFARAFDALLDQAQFPISDSLVQETTPLVEASIAFRTEMQSEGRVLSPLLHAQYLWKPDSDRKIAAEMELLLRAGEPVNATGRDRATAFLCLIESIVDHVESAENVFDADECESLRVLVRHGAYISTREVEHAFGRGRRFLPVFSRTPRRRTNMENIREQSYLNLLQFARTHENTPMRSKLQHPGFHSFTRGVFLTPTLREQLDGGR